MLELVVSLVKVLDVPNARSVLGVAEVEVESTVVRGVLGRLLDVDGNVVEKAVVGEVWGRLLVGGGKLVEGPVVVLLAIWLVEENGGILAEVVCAAISPGFTIVKFAEDYYSQYLFSIIYF